MRRTVLTLLAITLMATALYSHETTPDPEVTGQDQLVKEKGRFQETWVRPDADMSRFDRLYLWDSLFQFREGGHSASGTEISRSREEGPFAVRKEDQEQFKKLVRKTVSTVLAGSKRFDLVDTVGPGTLLVRPAILDIVSNVPPNVAGTRTNVYLTSVGEATIVFELIDAETGVIQARVGERRRIQAPGRMHQVNTQPANSATIWNDVKLWANDVAQTLRRELEKAKKKADR